MKKIKVFYGDTRLKDIYPHATKWQVLKYKTAQLIRKVFMLGVAVMGVVTIVLILSNDTNATTTVFNNIETVVSEREVPPVMKRIAKCESNDMHFKKNGQVVTNANTNKTVDIGRHQINETVWGEKAGEMGLDLTNEADNEKMAMWIYENFGTEDWKYSSHCWRY